MGGAIRTLEEIEKILISGTDKIFVYFSCYKPGASKENDKNIYSLVIVASVDVKKEMTIILFSSTMEKKKLNYIEEWIKNVDKLNGGDIDTK